MLHALINPDNEIDYTHDFLDLPIPNTKQGWRWVPVEPEERPSYNINTQEAYQTDIVEADRVRRVWNIRDKDAGQIAGEKLQKINAVDPVIIAALLDLYNLSNEPLTLEQYKDRLKGLI